MEPNQPRLLAYTLAKSIDLDELTEVTGASMQMSTKKTTLFTGHYEAGMDVEYDVSVDM